MESAIEKLLQDNKVVTMEIGGLGVNSEFEVQKPYTFGTMVTRALMTPCGQTWLSFTRRQKQWQY
jgi:hypothetical protein